MRIGYLKLGRNMPLTQGSWGFTGGDDEPPLLLRDLASRNPAHEFVIIGRNSGEVPQSIGMPENVTNPWTQWNEETRGQWGLPKNAEGKRDGSLKYTDQDHLIMWFNDVVVPEFVKLDHVITWLGQHGTSNSPIPPVGSSWDDPLTTPQDAFRLYSHYGIHGINAWRDAAPHEHAEIHLIADARNYSKARDLKWPITRPILGQFNMTREAKHERFGDPLSPEHYGMDARWEGDHVWVAPEKYIYSRLEICGILPHHIDSLYAEGWHARRRFGLFINEARAYVGANRKDALEQYVLPLKPDFIHGTWSKKSLEELGMNIQPAPWDAYYPSIRSVRCTFTTPSSGSGWATTKPWQAFAVGTVCFFHPAYDTQNNILADADPHLATWLRVTSPDELRARVDYLEQDETTWLWLVRAQRALYDRACEESRHLRLIEEELCL